MSGEVTRDRAIGDLGAVAHYNLLERVGEGGLGEVYRARDTSTGRTVALKLVPFGLAEGQRWQRLMDDARAAAGLSHPNIATLFDVGHHDERLYLAYEFVQGATLRQQMSGGGMNAGHAIALAAQVADALAEAHSRGVVHKDLRPDTVLETMKGSVKVLDFGMSIWTRGGQVRALAGAAPGSVGTDALPVVAYMSPEQARGGRVDHRTDLFSLGVILYEMLTGVNPYAAGDPAGILVRITQDEPPVPSTIDPGLPKMVDLVLSRVLSRDPGMRPDTAVKLAAELRRCGALMEGNAAEPAVARPR
ncbi:MAG: serine/threonine protein kinase, partial [Gemmatimonadaceae bacterium]|nr:serine/threonine protein kinase [Gemmatimonadaceae bacterium]